MKQHIKKVKCQCNLACGNKARVHWEFLQYEIRKFSIELSKNKTKLSAKNYHVLKLGQSVN